MLIIVIYIVCSYNRTIKEKKKSYVAKHMKQLKD